jgi:hypothetical protein
MKKKGNYQPLLIVLLVLALAAVGWFIYARWQAQKAAVIQQQEAAALKQKTEALTQEVANLETDLKDARGDTAAEEAAEAVLGPGAAPEEAPPSIKSIESQVKAFFDYLDGRDYVKSYDLPNGMFSFYLESMDALAAHPPQVAGESQSLNITIDNVKHFYLAMGIKNTRLAAEILKNESQVLEPAMRLFFNWYTSPEVSLAGKPSLETMYAYAGFFLDTLGGRSYLLRRDSKIRFLSIYYCLRVLDLSQDKGINPNGIDIRPFIATAIGDIGNQQGLVYRKEYTAELQRLENKYPLQ